MILSLFHDNPISTSFYSSFEEHQVLARLKALDSLIRRKGLSALNPGKNRLIPIGTETDSKGRVTKNGYGVFNLSWQVEQHPEWPERVMTELYEIRARIKETHDTRLRFLVWAGMGGSAEDKSMYNAVGLLKRSPRCYVLDSTDPAKLKAILDDMVRRSGLRQADVLRSTLVVGMAMGMTSYEPVVNLERLAALYDKHGIDSRPNFIYMTLAGSLLDEFAGQRGYRRVELQLDNKDTTAGRHSGPLTRGSLYPLGFCRADLRSWCEGAVLDKDQIHTAWRLASFLHAQAMAGRDKVTLLLPRPWAGAGIWTKQDFEESLGKSEQLGIKIIIESKMKLANCRSPKDPRQDRAFLAVKVKGFPVEKPDKTGLLRRSGYPVASLTLPRGTQLSTYMQFIHYTVFGLAFLRNMNFVTQPSVELYKTITNRLFAESQKVGGVEKCDEWQKMVTSPRRIRHRGCVTLYYDRLALDFDADKLDAPTVYANIVKRLEADRRIEYAELTFFGDTRYSQRGRMVLKALNRSAEKLFRSRLKMPVDVYEGPAMNHSYHEMIIGHGKCLSTVILSEKAERLPAAGYAAQYHIAQFLATQMALAERGRFVVAITIKDLEEPTIVSLEDFFRQAGTALKAIRV